MARYGTSITCQAGAAITKRRFVKISAVATNDAVCKVIQCAAATDWPIGISYTDQATVGDNLTVHTPYNAIREIEVGAGGVTVNDDLTSDSVGRAIRASAGNNYMARALTTALAGDLVIAFIYGSEVSGLFTGDILAADGTVSLPSVSFADDPDCGRYRIGANNIGDAVNGAKVLDVGVAGLGVTGTITPSGQIIAIAGTVGAPGYAIAGELDCGFYLIGAGNVGLAIDGAKILDIDASGINAIIGATTPAAGVFTDITGTGGNIAAKAATSKLDDLVANTTTRTTIFVAPSNLIITKAQIGFYAIPASAIGTVLGNLKTWDASGDVERDLLETADLDMEGFTAKEGTALTLQTTNPEYLQLDAGDTVYWESVSNNADMTGGTDGALTLEFTLD